MKAAQAWDDRGIGNDRLLFCCLLALVVHAGLILGVGFSREEHAPRAPGLDVTLAQFRHETPDAAADFLAQANQRGSGEQAVKSEQSTPVSSDFDAPLVRPVVQPAPAAPAAAGGRPPELSSTHSDRVDAPAQLSAPLAPAQPPSDNPVPETRSAEEIASLVARLDAQQKAYAKLPRVQRLTSVSTRETADAAYLFQWKQRVETIGNRNYPLEAKRRRLYGDLRLLVTLRPDGSVKEVRVLQSSGYRLLDDSAMQIVRLSAPFDPFPPEIRARADELEIIRTWQFRSNTLRSVD